MTLHPLMCQHESSKNNYILLHQQNIIITSININSETVTLPNMWSIFKFCHLSQNVLFATYLWVMGEWGGIKDLIREHALYLLSCVQFFKLEGSFVFGFQDIYLL